MASADVQKQQIEVSKSQQQEESAAVSLGKGGTSFLEDESMAW
ncbi:MAG: hypothetical protein ABGY24_15870 [bacterium]